MALNAVGSFQTHNAKINNFNFTELISNNSRLEKENSKSKIKDDKERELADKIIKTFEPRIIVVACNTMSVNTIDVLREVYPDTFFVEEFRI